MDRRLLASLVGAIFSFGILTCWVTEKWALASFQCSFFLLAVVWLFLHLRKRDPLELHWLVGATAAVAVLAFFQIVTNSTVNRDDTTAAMLAWICNSVAMFLVIQFANRSHVRDLFVTGMLWFAAGVSVLGIVQNFTSEGKIFWLFDSGYKDLVLGPFVYRNKYAQFIELFLPVALFRAVRNPNEAIRSLAIAATMLAGSIAAGSRSGVVLTVLEVIVFLIVVRLRGWVEKRRVVQIVVQASILVAICGGIVGWEFLGGRLKQDPLDDVRIPIMLSTVDMIKDRPLTGFGLGTWDKAYPAYARFDSGLYTNQAHCDWLQWPSEGGIVMLGLTLALGAAAVKYGLASPWSLGVLFVFIHGLVDYPMQQVPQFATLVLAILAAAAAEQGGNRRRFGLAIS